MGVPDPLSPQALTSFSIMISSAASVQSDANSDDEAYSNTNKIIRSSGALIVEPVTFPPTCKPVPDDVLSGLARHKVFSVQILAAACYHECSAGAFRQYLDSCGEDVVKSELADPANDRHHVLTHAVCYNNADILRMLLEHGLDPNARDFGDVPVLAFAIMLPFWRPCNTTEIVRLLLAYGSSPRHIRQEMWIDYIQTSTIISDKSEGSTWCTAKLREILAETLHLTMRYNLWTASRLENERGRMMQIAKARGISPLLDIPLFIIAQEPAAQQVVDEIFSHIASDSEGPLVLEFSGPSGVGKRQLARNIGELISAEFIDINATQLTTVFSLLGMTAGYHESETGSPLNKFLISNQRQRSVVFIDEFDKTTRDGQEALLKVMDAGKHDQELRRSENCG